MSTIAIANQKGGVGKTTIALALATGMSELVGRRVLFVDLDTQANSTVGLGIRPEPGVANWLLFNEKLDGVVKRIQEKLDLVPSDSSTREVDNMLVGKARISERKAVAALKTSLNGTQYDSVVIDCPPSLSMITRMAIYASDYVLTPVDCEFFALQGLVTLAALIKEMQDLGSKVRWLGVVPNKYRLVQVHDINLARLKNRLGEDLVWRSLPLTTQIPKAQEAGESIWSCSDVDKRHKALWAIMLKKVLDYA